MTQRVSREQLEDAIFSAGIRSPYVKQALLRVIEGYVASQVLLRVPLCDVPVRIAPYAELGPGESDMTAEMTRCQQCLLVKEWGSFHRDGNSRTGHKLTCRSCLRLRNANPPGKTGLYTCRWCKGKYPLGGFPEAKRANRSLAVPCLNCEKDDEETESS